MGSKRTRGTGVRFMRRWLMFFGGFVLAVFIALQRRGDIDLHGSWPVVGLVIGLGVLAVALALAADRRAAG